MKMILHYEDGTSQEVELTFEDLQRVRDERPEQFSGGDRVKLTALAQNPRGYDDRPNLPPGTEGVVVAIAGRVTDDGGNLRVQWDNGSSLSATPMDVVERLTRPE